MASSTLPPRFEIRKLEPKHLTWAQAIITWTNSYKSPVWTPIYTDLPRNAYSLYNTSAYFVNHGITSGHSWGVFDTEYQYKHPESAEAGGRLLWDPSNMSATEDDLLDQMDFPLVSVGLAYDGINEIDMAQMAVMMEALPLLGTLFHTLENEDKRDPASWKPKAAGEVLLRNGTSTRGRYEGMGLAKTLAHFIMRDAAAKGFRGIQIETANRAVEHIWLNPPPPFKGEIVSTLHTGEFEEEVDGVKVKPFAPSSVLCTKIYLTLV
ncbi:hypothetical protein B0T19DRAFT_446977 [Cercophora scortea]|uniref:Uncharacterized protein n=1 Tax=Cercophora scortea TaxID=314031 RepID=A0AAE0MKA4_9PEZI|nr:hypothetical protein B0T19DRAFT_446977 [Cercophora scortea]